MLLVYRPIPDWSKYMVEEVNCATDQFAVALSNTNPEEEANPPTKDGNGKLANVTQISYQNCSSRLLTKISSSQSGGVYKLKFKDLILLAQGGEVGPFRYIYIYDNTHPDKPLVCYFDIGYNYTMESGSFVKLEFDKENGLFFITPK